MVMNPMVESVKNHLKNKHKMRWVNHLSNHPPFTIELGKPDYVGKKN